MGLLDEAIREHLQLKREHGADPGELTRLEQEALSPPVRETQEALEATPPEQAPVAEPPEPGLAEAPEAAAPVAEPPEPPAAEPSAPAPVAERPEPVGPPTVAFDSEQAFAGEPAAGPPAPASPPASPPAPATPAPEGEDVLEETPEFLQETPEHDRLWFEQKPPRDFDFDG